jgi:hypothetical protein
LHQKTRAAEVEEKIRSVEGINKRMVNLIQEFRQSEEKDIQKSSDRVSV